MKKEGRRRGATVVSKGETIWKNETKKKCGGGQLISLMNLVRDREAYGTIYEKSGSTQGHDEEITHTCEGVDYFSNVK